MQPASDQVQIIAKPHPLRTDTYTCTTRAGCMLAELLEDTPETVHVQVNGEHWPRSRWHEPLPPGIVNVYAVPQGGERAADCGDDRDRCGRGLYRRCCGYLGEFCDRSRAKL